MDALGAWVLAQQTQIANLEAQLPRECRVRMVDNTKEQEIVSEQVFTCSFADFQRLQKMLPVENLGTPDNMICECFVNCNIINMFAQWLLDYDDSIFNNAEDPDLGDLGECIVYSLVAVYWAHARGSLAELRDYPGVADKVRAIANLKPGYTATGFLGTLEINIE